MIEYENLKEANKIFFEEYKKRFSETLNSGWFILGKNVEIFEKEFAAYCNANFCIGVNSGLDALFLALKVYDFKEGSEVIVPSNTYIATILSILQAGLKPVLVEPDITTYNINPDLVEEKITEKTVAIMVVHLYGKCCEMDKINILAQQHQLVVVEDCAQAHGSKFKGSLSGNLGDIGAFSFYPTKNLGALGDGGGITVNDSSVAGKIRMYRNYGSSVKYHNEVIGINSRLDEIQAAFLSVKLTRLDEINSHKRKLANLYNKNLKDDFIKPTVNPDYFDTYHIYAVRHEKRNQLKEYLLKNEIKTEIHYPVSPHKQNAMKDLLGNYEFPVSTKIHDTILSLPVSFCHSENDIYRVIEVMNKF